jgi:hypothetical protein
VWLPDPVKLPDDVSITSKKFHQGNRDLYMDDITSRDGEKGRELAAEKGRKQGLEEEHNREKRKTGWGRGMKAGIFVVVLAIIVFVIAILTLSVSVTNVSPGDTLPYTTTYGTSFPEGQTITIGNTQISAISYQDSVNTDINGEQQQLAVGDDRTISEQRAVVTTLGIITLMDTNFQIDLTYKGDRDNRAYFDIAIHTARQVPAMLIRQLLPSEIDATPM